MRLVTMTEDDFQQWFEPFIRSYAQEHIKTGRWSEENGVQLAKKEMIRTLPEGQHTENHYFYSLMAEAPEQKVGMLWFSVQENSGGRRIVYIQNIDVDKPFRRHGYASAAFAEVEKKATELGVDEIALHVFGHNHAARALYEKLGYQVTNLVMAKSLYSR